MLVRIMLVPDVNEKQRTNLPSFSDGVVCNKQRKVKPCSMHRILLSSLWLAPDTPRTSRTDPTSFVSCVSELMRTRQQSNVRRHEYLALFESV
jgi:hypothetical protein